MNNIVRGAFQKFDRFSSVKIEPETRVTSKGLSTVLKAIKVFPRNHLY